MPEQRINIHIDPDGRITASTEGFKGEACMEELSGLLGALADLSELKKTDEYHQKVTHHRNNFQKNDRK